MCPDNYLHTYTHASFDENLFPCCPGACPHRAISKAPQHPHHHPPLETPSYDNGNDDDNIPQPCDCHTNEDFPPPVRSPLPDIPPHHPESPPLPPVTPLRCHPHLNAPPALPRQSEDIERESCWRELTGKAEPSALASPPVPGTLPPFPSPSEGDVKRLVQEGGDVLVSYICANAIPMEEEVTNPNYCKWSYHNILYLLQSEQKLWFEACKEELDMLKQCKVYEIVY
ncbi:hypothetical protein PAXRUDRAFT_162075 [Paxillus rubicundulus Ve08.2h10]|uniref:Uncharacterized protein n=1 Tax=Paxillus rubicundulus Ve08.2h10 TaxID=930991 RepID=A0A0D0DE86_9AGAM|nr:hypothetical protein PAXRUDRAFT_162075 [Paxillus rubicundulus Ve08.2h10]